MQIIISSREEGHCVPRLRPPLRGRTACYTSCIKTCADPTQAVSEADAR